MSEGLKEKIDEKISKLDPSIQLRVKDVLKLATDPYTKTPDVLGVNINDIASMDDVSFKEFAERLSKSKYNESSSIKQ